MPIEQNANARSPVRSGSGAPGLAVGHVAHLHPVNDLDDGPCTRLAALAAQCAPRTSIGRQGLDFRSFPQKYLQTLTIAPAAMMVVLPLTGQPNVMAEGYDDVLRPGDGAFIARTGKVDILWPAGSRGIRLTLQRSAVQAAASRLYGSPSRLAASGRTVAFDCAETGKATLLTTLCDILAGERAMTEDAREGLILSAAVEAIGPRGFIASRTVKAVIEYLAGYAGQDVSVERLAALAQVTERTLRASFREVVGDSLPAYIQRVQFQWIHDRLASARDARPIGYFAKVAGYGKVSSFSRAYRDLRGEAPTETRARAVRLSDLMP